MENPIEIVDAPEMLKLVVFEKPTLGNQVIAALAGTALTLTVTVGLPMLNAVVQKKAADKIAKKQAKEAEKRAEKEIPETTEEDED